MTRITYSTQRDNHGSYNHGLKINGEERDARSVTSPSVDSITGTTQINHIRQMVKRATILKITSEIEVQNK